MRPTTRPNFLDSSDESEGGLLEAFHKRTKPSDLSADKPTDQPSDLSADKPTDQPSDLSADKPTDQPSESGGIDQGIAVGESVGFDAIHEEEAQVVLNKQEQDFFDQHNDHCEVCNQPGKIICCATCNLVFHLHCARPKLHDEPPDDWKCAYCCALGLGVKNDAKERRKAKKACREMERMTRECVKEHANEDEGSSKGGVPCAAPLDDHFFHDMNEDNNNDHDDDEDHEDDEDDEDYHDHVDDNNHEDNEDNEDDEDDDDVGTFSNEVEGGVPGAPHLTLIKKLHYLNQTPSYRRSVIENNEIIQLIKKLNQMKSRGEIGGKPCSLGTSWTYKKKEIGKHRIGRMVGQCKSFIVFPEIICTGNAPSLIEVINAIKQTKNTKIRKEVSIIEVPVDALEYCGYEPFVQNAKAFITSRFELIYGLKNKNGELEMYHMGNVKGEGRKTVVIPRRMFVDGPRNRFKQFTRGRFGLMCFSANRDKSDWERCECDHINGDCTDDREENVRWLTPTDNKRSYNNKRARGSNAARA
jgi:hypothetical protein